MPLSRSKEPTSNARTGMSCIDPVALRITCWTRRPWRA
jgi:hypothetical protein